MFLNAYDHIDRNDPGQVERYLTALLAVLERHISAITSSGNSSVRESKLLADLRRLVRTLKQLLDASAEGRDDPGAEDDDDGSRRRTTVVAATRPGPSTASSGATILTTDSRVSGSIRALLAFRHLPVSSNQDDTTLLRDYYQSVRDSLAPRMGEFLRTDEVSLPSPAVFMEPILSHAKGAELYDMRRNSHYALLESPSIAAGDPNVLRGREVDLTPTQPAATLSIQAPPDLALPGSLAAALGEAGKLNLDALVNSNASSLSGMLANLSALATELAKASAQLTGDAQQQALASATDVAKQVGDVVNKSLAAPTGTAAAPAATPSPQTQQQKAEVAREAERIDRGSGSDTQKKELKKTIGAATAPDDQRNYRFGVTFLDALGIPYLAASSSSV